MIPLWHKEPEPYPNGRILCLTDLINGYTQKDEFSFCEVGVFMGDVAHHLLDAFPGMNYVGVDLWKEQDSSLYQDDANNQYLLDLAKARTLERCKPYIDRTSFLEMSSAEASFLFKDNDFDIIYIDANHSTDAVYSDIMDWWFKSKTVVSGHDYTEGWESVIAGVTKAQDALNFKITSDRPRSSVWWTIKEAK